MSVCSPMLVMSLGVQTIYAQKTFKNPVIHADYSDPDVTASADGSTFYMTASSFQNTPGLPVLRSDDLVNWTLVNHALDSVPPVDYYGAGIPRHGKGVWAPCIREHNGEYYIYWGDPDFGIFMVKTDNPEGKWSSPVLVRPGKGLIDPSPFWDEDGKAYLANGWAASRAGLNSILTISEMSQDGTHLISTPKIVYDGNDGVNHTVEGPKMYKHDGYYYLFAPAGGVATGWQLVMRSKNVFGPYESKIVMAQGDTGINGPHQGAWVTTDMGEDWFLHFQDKGAYGRVIHLNPLTWKDHWPVIGADQDGDGCGDPVAFAPYPKTKSSLQTQKQMKQADKLTGMLTDTSMENLFQWHSNYNDLFGFPITGGLMRVYSHQLSAPQSNLWEVPNLWMMKFPAEEFTFTAVVKIGGKCNTPGVSSGIVVMGWDYCRFGLTETEDGKLALQLVSCTEAETGGEEIVKEITVIEPGKIYPAGLIPNMETPIKLRVTVRKDAICSFSYSIDGKRFIKVAPDFKSRAGKWIGAKVGFYSIMPPEVKDRGWIDVIDVTVD